MSRTGCFYAEIWRNNQWEPLLSPKWSQGKQIPVACANLHPPYEFYTALFGYERWSTYPLYHTEPIVPIAEPRGFPHDMNPIYQEYFKYAEYCTNDEYRDSYRKYHYLTWFLVQEVIDYDWNRKFAPFTSYVKSQYASLFSASNPFPEDFPEGEKIYNHREEGMVEVSWVESYHDFVGCKDWFIEELLKLGDPKEVRIIFWLDW
jgi:hypothetical protein